MAINIAGGNIAKWAMNTYIKTKRGYFFVASWWGELSNLGMYLVSCGKIVSILERSKYFNTEREDLWY